MNGKEKKPVKRIQIKENTHTIETIEDEIAEESLLTIFLNEKELVTIFYTPSNTVEMIIGYLFNEHFINGINDIRDISLDPVKKTATVKIENQDAFEDIRYRRFLRSDCTNPVSFKSLVDAAMIKPLKSNYCFSIVKIKHFLDEMGRLAFLYRSTGCTHSACICSDNKIIFLAEDIGRHNAVDKVIGFCIKNNIELSNKTLITSGRITSGIVLKTINAEIPIIVSRAAPTTRSLNLAKDYGITLVGFMRGKKANVYTHIERITELKEILK